jgi:hypothetical protein
MYFTKHLYNTLTSRILLNNVTCSKFEQIYFLSTFANLLECPHFNALCKVPCCNFSSRLVIFNYFNRLSRLLSTFFFKFDFGRINILTFASQLGFRIYSVVKMWLYCVYFSKLQRYSKISTSGFNEKSRKMPTCVVLGCKNIQFRNCGKSFHRFVKYKTRLIHMWRGKNCLLRGRWFFKANYKKIIATLHPAF